MERTGIEPVTPPLYGGILPLLSDHSNWLCAHATSLLRSLSLAATNVPLLLLRFPRIHRIIHMLWIVRIEHGISLFHRLSFVKILWRLIVIIIVVVIVILCVNGTHDI